MITTVKPITTTAFKTIVPRIFVILNSLKKFGAITDMTTNKTRNMT